MDLEAERIKKRDLLLLWGRGRVCIFLFDLNLWYVTPNSMRRGPESPGSVRGLYFCLAPEQIQQHGSKYENKLYSQEEKITYFGVLFHEEVFYLKERKRKRKLHLINLHGADIFPVLLCMAFYKWYIFSNLQAIWIMGPTFFLLHAKIFFASFWNVSIWWLFYLRIHFLSSLLAYFFLCCFCSILICLISAGSLLPAPFNAQGAACSGKRCHFSIHEDRKMSQGINM